MHSLRKGQKEFVEQYNNGAAAIAAIPGGGKTFSLSYWAAQKIIEAHRGESELNKILIVTYMNSAANSFKERIKNILLSNGITNSSKYECSTIHSLCMQIVKDGSKLATIDEEFVVIDENERAKLIKDIALKIFDQDVAKYSFIHSKQSENLTFDEAEEIRKEYTNNAISIVSMIRNRNIEKQDCHNTVLDFYNKVAREYKYSLDKMGYVDFDDMINLSYKFLVEDDELREKYKRMYTYVCEDEAQDSNDMQYKILDILADGNLVRVGDANQAISGSFTSSSIDSFNNFCNRADVKKFDITQSTRNTVNIINLANAFVKKVIYKHSNVKLRNALVEQIIEPIERGEIVNPTTDYFGITCNIHQNEYQHNQFIIDLINKQQKKQPDMTCALLVPTNKKVNEMAALCEKNNIEYEILGQASKESRFVIKAMSLLLSIKVGYVSSTTKDELKELLTPYGYNVDEVLEKLEQISIFPESKCIAKISGLLTLNDMQISIVNAIINKLFVLQYSGKVDALASIVEELCLPKNSFVQYACTLNEFAGYSPSSGVVTITTYHKAKGLEWDCVILGSVTDISFPFVGNEYMMGFNNKFKSQYQNLYAYVSSILNSVPLEKVSTEYKEQIIAEKIRLMYVAITRAKKVLHINAYQNKLQNAKLSMFYELKNLVSAVKEEYSK